MKLKYLIQKLKFRIKSEGLDETLKMLVYLNRNMIVVEKQIHPEEPLVFDEYTEFIRLDNQNLRLYKKKSGIENFSYYCQKGAECLAAFRNNECIGYQWWTRDNSFADIQKLGIRLAKDEAYLFDLFVSPDYRGTLLPKILVREVFSHLITVGVNKIYGFYFSDNIKALWWHRAILKCKELKRLRSHRVVWLEWTDGKLRLTV